MRRGGWRVHGTSSPRHSSRPGRRPPTSGAIERNGYPAAGGDMWRAHAYYEGRAAQTATAPKNTQSVHNSEQQCLKRGGTA